MKTLGKKISDYRKARGMTQEELADKTGVSSQAVSKWENDLSIPDLPVLLELADLFGVTLDQLVRSEDAVPAAQMLPESQRKPLEQLVLRVVVNSGGDHIKVNVPIMLVKVCLEMGVGLPEVNSHWGQGIKNVEIDWAQVLALVDRGVIGKLVEIQSDDGDVIEVYVE